ncbi:hypothetical protein [Campylobacter sp.]|uniref:hypothetical protein n=1 Tax=Campylobacter sp. TaxID=205 RepID=UPI0027B9E775|nr:hypothetical protein [Campylobacter sp.]
MYKITMNFVRAEARMHVKGKRSTRALSKFKILKSQGNFAERDEPFARQNLTIIASLLLNFKILRQALEF